MTDGLVVGTDVKRFTGEVGLRKLGRYAIIDVDDRAGFQARIVQSAFQSLVTIRALSFPPLRAVRLNRGRANPPDLMSIHLLQQGRFSILGNGTTLLMEAGDAAVIDSRTAVQFHSTEAVRLLQVTIRLDELPQHIRNEPPLPFGALHRTILIDAYQAFLRAVLERCSEDPGSTPQLHRSVLDLTLGVITEAIAAQDHRQGTDVMRSHIKNQIEQRLADPTLSAVTIAEALGVSSRHIHKTFETEGITISRYITEQRLRAAAIGLRTQTTRARSSQLAFQYGFGGADQLSRAFRRRYGVTLEEYRLNIHLYRL